MSMKNPNQKKKKALDKYLAKREKLLAIKEEKLNTRLKIQAESKAKKVKTRESWWW